MPQPNKKRGRRMEGKKRKHDEYDDGPDDAQPSAAGEMSGNNGKRRKSTLNGDDASFENDYAGEEGSSLPIERAFFGSLDDEEQEYFRRADDMLESNAFADAEERGLFLANVYREAEGKELKLAQSQSCSRLLERLIQLSTPAQLKQLFQSFHGNFIHLITHRFASHCCEALFRQAAGVVSDEVKAPHKKSNTGSKEESEPEASMESLYMDTLAELEGNIGFLLTDRYASHALRILLLVLAGEPLETAQAKRILQSKRKETNVVQSRDPNDIRPAERPRSVPDSFSNALEQLIAESIAGLDTAKLRAFATHPNGNPTLQLLLQLELSHFGKQRAKDEASVIRTLLPDDPITADSDSAAFINGLVYDPIGSHLVERIIQHAPGKMFKTLYQEFFKNKLASYARNEVAGYISCRVLERLGHDDLLEAHGILIPHITSLLQKNRTVVVRTLIERCTVRGIDTKAIAVQVDQTWHGPDGFEIKKLVKFGTDEAASEDRPHDSTQNSSGDTPTAAFSRSIGTVKTHFNILAQAMLLVPGALSALVLDSLIGLDTITLLNMAKDSIVSRTLQAALTTKNSSMSTTRKLIQHFYGHIGEMSIESAASHVVDCIWEGTHGLAFIRERIAEELAENEAQLRESSCGRAVWKNWKMDLYKRHRADWVRQSRVKASNDGFQSFSELDVNKDGATSGAEKKTPLQLARERHAKKKAAKEKEGTEGKRGSAKSDSDGVQSNGNRRDEVA